MADATMTHWPSLRVHYQAEGTANQNLEPPHTPTWPAALESPYITAGPPQPNLCLQVTQVLEWEIWNHDHTRERLCTEQARCEWLNERNRKLEQDIVQWRKSCDTVYAALSDHRVAHASLQRDMDGVLAEISELRQQQSEAKPVIHEVSVPETVQYQGRCIPEIFDDGVHLKNDDHDDDCLLCRSAEEVREAHLRIMAKYHTKSRSLSDLSV